MNQWGTPARWCGGLLFAIAACAVVGTVLGVDEGGAATFAVAFTLDIPVAVLLLVVLRPFGRRRAMTAMLLRLGYAVVALTMVIALAATGRLADFDAGFEIVLLIFGPHLVLVGWLLAVAPHVPRMLGPLIALGGVGYVVTGSARLADVTLPAPAVGVLGVLALAELGLAVSLLRNPAWTHRAQVAQLVRIPDRVDVADPALPDGHLQGRRHPLAE